MYSLIGSVNFFGVKQPFFLFFVIYSDQIEVPLIFCVRMLLVYLSLIKENQTRRNF